ncbi:sugar MFS transporter [Paraferrimonas sp. SM1919]|uniref:sugar MFS transporter n=1 Tax=Paraferrimonas sp. SM1919 TaxID=2662263 RepID=UPI0013D7D84F|nr:sugar MFS transporter [Paraferrimonas sp. SM1919]
MAIPAGAEQAVNTTTGKTPAFAMTALTSLFFMWGFITCLNDILIPHLKTAFDLSYTQAMLIQFCFFGAYFIVSVPAGILLKKIGYQKGIVTGLLIAAVGCGMFYPAASIHSYPLFLGALFVLASGITLLQVSANPYVTIIGDAKTASSRLTLTQAFNSLGTTVAPWFGALLILDSATELAQNGAESVQVPYLVLTSMLLILAVIFGRLSLPQPQIQETKADSNKRAWDHSHLMLGVIGIFCYVGAEVAIGSLLVNLLGESHIMALPEHDAAKLLTYYWGGAMVGRFVGAAVMQKLDAGKVLGFNALMVIALLLITSFASGEVVMVAVLAIGLFNSIMFPTIFSLALQKLGSLSAQGSSLLCLAIVGGAIVPVVQGYIADTVTLQLSFLLPIICYLFIAFYGYKGSRPA